MASTILSYSLKQIKFGDYMLPIVIFDLDSNSVSQVTYLPTFKGTFIENVILSSYYDSKNNIAIPNGNYTSNSGAYLVVDSSYSTGLTIYNAVGEYSLQANNSNAFMALLHTPDDNYYFAWGSANVNMSPLFAFYRFTYASSNNFGTLQFQPNYDTTRNDAFTINSSSTPQRIGNVLIKDVVDTPSDPYDNAGDSDTGGGGGSWDDGSDPVNIPNLPSVGATNTGFISLFVPSQSQLKQVAEYMWGGLFDLSTYKRLFEDPMDCILGLSVVPVSVPTSGNANITVGNIELSGISLPVAAQQYVEVDCGSLTVKPYFGSYLDYEPYTKMSLFVPYSGVHTVNADDLMGRTVNLVYHIDILTGSLVAFLKCGESVLYEFNGACSSNIPVNSINYASTIENAIRIAVNIGTTVATAGASAPLSTGAEGVSQGVAGAQNIARGVSLAGSTADGALSLKPNIDRAGSLGGTTGLLGNQIPYFIITRPRLCKPKDQNKIKGYPAFINYSVSDLVGNGYTEFDTILLKNLYLTDDEKNELESILKGGVYL